MYLKKNNGFTLLEMMIVIAIITVLAAIALPMYLGFVAKAQVTRAVAEMYAATKSVEAILGSGSIPVAGPNSRPKNIYDQDYEWIGWNGTNLAKDNMSAAATIETRTKTFHKGLAVENGSGFNGKLRPGVVKMRMWFGRDSISNLHQGMIIMIRDSSGHWQCLIQRNSSSFKEKWIPSSCKDSAIDPHLNTVG